MATITERLEALEDVREASAQLKDRIEALEKRIQAFNESLTAGEKQYGYLKELPDGRCKEINETTQGIAQALHQHSQSTQDLAGPFEKKISELSNRLKAMEGQIGISS
jgi:predicted  nucleic acid-binding Zn-ribbon protein